LPQYTQLPGALLQAILTPYSRLSAGERCAIKILENVAENIEEIEEEYLVLRDLSLHPNIPSFKGLFLKRGSLPEEDQLWFVMEVVANICYFYFKIM
jgi:serine/threonine protein kinase